MVKVERGEVIWMAADLNNAFERTRVRSLNPAVMRLRQRYGQLTDTPQKSLELSAVRTDRLIVSQAGHLLDTI